MASTPRTPRRGLPRVPGGEPWPPAASDAPGPQGSAEPAVVESEDRAGIGRKPAADPNAAPVSDSAGVGAVASGVPGAEPVSDSAGVGAVASGVPEAGRRDAASPGVRRGLPREPGGEPWPPISQIRPDLADARGDAARSVPSSEDRAAAPRAPLTLPRTVRPGVAASLPHPPKREPRTIGPYTPVQWAGSLAVLGTLALVLVALVVVIARVLLSLPSGQAFLAAYPGEYPLPDAAPVGIPAWLNWSHFLNSFFLLLIIRTGWQVHREKRPAAFWSPRGNKRRRISLALWFHQSLDILWIANGVLFVVLLFVTGQWMRIVPTSWDVFPNAVSAALQYAALDWPTENGWVNYNSLQQLSYFAITFVAAPVAIVTGVRLSGVWPRDAERLNRLFPAEWARKLHYPTMLFFVAFIVVHVTLVLATGALRNLDHMYAARGSVDADAFAGDPTGLLIFAASLLVMAAGWVAARPSVLIPIARLFGDVKQR
ncbi:cytochrome b/b6 domain-containing protein [Microbacterium sp. HMH0099]|uniref:cytochrome b/b6 domain-containing protein n=1 Tax=Microbacterium sp. HMH0099 TaxID=3414026 RepID=UPI003BF645FE